MENKLHPKLAALEFEQQWRAQARRDKIRFQKGEIKSYVVKVHYVSGTMIGHEEATYYNERNDNDEEWK